MVSRSGPGLLGLLGVSLFDPSTTEVLQEFGVPTPQRRPDGSASADAGPHGLTIRFERPEALRDGASLSAAPDDLLASVIFFYPPGTDGYAAYSGELPFGLTFDEPRASMWARLGPPASGSEKSKVNRWDFDRDFVAVDFTPDDRIVLVTVGLHWTGRVRQPPPVDGSVAALTARYLARGPQRRVESAELDIPPELAALRREQAAQDTPFYADESRLGDFAIELTDRPPSAHRYLSGTGGAGLESFFADVRWLGQDREGAALGYWKAGVDTFVGAPVIRLDTGGGCEVVGATLVDYYAGLIGEHAPELVGFCRRVGLPPPGTEEARRAAVARRPDPYEVLSAVQQAWLKRVRADDPVRPVDRDPRLVALADGTVVVVSSEDAVAEYRPFAANAAFLFDPVAERFRLLPQTSAPITLTSTGVGVLRDGRALFVELDREMYCVMFDPATTTWTVGARLATDRRDAAAVLLPDGRLLIAGGEMDWRTHVTACHLYDPVQDTWAVTGDLATARSKAALVPVPGGALAFGGWAAGGAYACTAACERYDLATGRWTPAATGPFPMSGLTALVLRSGLILVNAQEGWGLYDPDRDAWIRSGREESAGRGAVELADGRVAFFGPRAGHPPETVVVLDPITGDLAAAGTTMLPRRRSAAAMIPGGAVLLVGDDLFGNIPQEPEIWDPATGESHAPAGLAQALERQVRNLAQQRLIAPDEDEDDDDYDEEDGDEHGEDGDD
jgi:hypothetical protein